MRPFLKWAGNKYQIIDRIHETLAEGERLIEPFAGSGAVFLNTDYDKYLLADNNRDLINLYQCLKDDGQLFINYSKKLFKDSNNNDATFYKMREIFNSTGDVTFKSALFVYLNKHCFNGLCRYNNSGGFNSPFGKYKKPYFPEKEMQYFSKKAKSAIFKHADFVSVMNTAKKGDVVYCDPPYVPLSATANFTSYGAGGFSEVQQLQLASMARKLTEKGIPVVISNHDTEFTNLAYRGARISRFAVQRYISCNGAKRGKANEMLAVFQ